MPNPSQQRALPGKLHRYVIAGVALVGASIIAITPATSPLPDVHVPDIQLTAGEEDITIDFVRHADTTPPDAVSLIAGNGLPGDPVSATGYVEATQTANSLAGELGVPGGGCAGCYPDGGVEAIYGGYEQRMIETALPFLTLQGYSYTLNPAYGAISPGFTPMDGFDEVGGGIYEDVPSSVELRWRPGEHQAALT